MKENEVAADGDDAVCERPRIRQRRGGNGGACFLSQADRARYFEAKQRSRQLAIPPPPNPYYAGWEAFHLSQRGMLDAAAACEVPPPSRVWLFTERWGSGVHWADREPTTAEIFFGQGGAGNSSMCPRFGPSSLAAPRA